MCLITGGAGFVGSHLAEALLERGDEVFILDNLSTGSIDNIVHLKGNPRFHYTIDTVTNEPVLAELIDRCDIVVHLAAAVGVKLIVEQPVHTIETNVHGTEVVLKHREQEEEARADRVDVGGLRQERRRCRSARTPTSCSAPTSKHRWAYACSKMIDEFLALAYWKERKLPVIVVRLFNTVGPRQTGQYGMVIPNFVRQALAGQPITVFGDGTQSRSFTYVGDVVRAMVALIDEPRAIGQVFNIGNGKEITIGELAAKVKEMTGSSSDDRDDPVRPGVRGRVRGHAAPRARHRARSSALVGYEPTVELDEIADARHRVLSSAASTVMTQIHEASRRGAPRRGAHAARAGEACPPAAARDRARSRAAACPRSSRSRARTSATPSACSARATTCIAARAS